MNDSPIQWGKRQLCSKRQVFAHNVIVEIKEQWCFRLLIHYVTFATSKPTKKGGGGSRFLIGCGPLWTLCTHLWIFPERTRKVMTKRFFFKSICCVFSVVQSRVCTCTVLLLRRHVEECSVSPEPQWAQVTSPQDLPVIALTKVEVEMIIFYKLKQRSAFLVVSHKVHDKTSCSYCRWSKSTKIFLFFLSSP